VTLHLKTLFFQQLTRQAFLEMLRLINQVVRKEDLEKVQNVLEKAPNQDAQRNVGGRFGK
jgi:ribosomal 50S subunit-associated protein YjgA (DUF615 family)